MSDQLTEHLRMRREAEAAGLDLAAPWMPDWIRSEELQRADEAQRAFERALGMPARDTP